jgi:cytochrome c oxidase subunit 1
MPGHFHMTVAGPVFLAILGMSLYMLTKLTGKVLSPVMKSIAVIVPHLWMIGLFMFSAGLMWGGLLGEPRRTNLGISYLDPESPLYRPDWVPTTALALFGGVIMFSAAGLFFIILLNLLFKKRCCTMRSALGSWTISGHGWY